MSFVLAAVAAGLFAGLAAGGSLARLEATRLCRTWWLAGAIVAQLAASLLSTGWVYAAALVASLLLAAAFLLANPRLVGRALLAGGLGLNALVIVVNGGMPVVMSAARTAGVTIGPAGHDPRHVVADAHTRLALLDDRIPLPLPLQPQVLSGGDVLVAAGAALMVAQAMRRRTVAPSPIAPTRPTRPTRPAYPPRRQMVPGDGVQANRA